MATRLMVFLAGICIASMAGCVTVEERTPPTFVVDATLPVTPEICRRVLLLPPSCGKCPLQHMELLRSALRSELLKAGYAVDAPPANPDSAYGRVPTDGTALQALAQRANADGVLVVRVHKYRPYTPPTIELDASMFVPGADTAVWVVRATWNARDERVANRLRNFARNELEPGAARFGHVTVIESPHVFLSFVAHEIVGAMTEPPHGAAELSAPGSGPANTAPGRTASGGY